MLFAVNVLKRSIFLIIENFKSALFLTGSVYLAHILVVGLLDYIFTGSFSMEWLAFEFFGEDQSRLVGGSVTHGLLLIVISLFTFALMAILWHRFILCDDLSDPPPPVSFSLVFDYVIQSIIISILIAFACIPFMIIAAVLLFISAELWQFATVLLLPIFIFWLAQRLGIVLPAFAIGKQTYGEKVWAHTSEVSLQILIMGGLFSLCSFAAVAVISWLYTSIGGTLAIVVLSFCSWLAFLINVSILTTLYGHLVQGKSLD